MASSNFYSTSAHLLIVFLPSGSEQSMTAIWQSSGDSKLRFRSFSHPFLTVARPHPFYRFASEVSNSDLSGFDDYWMASDLVSFPTNLFVPSFTMGVGLSPVYDILSLLELDILDFLLIDSMRHLSLMFHGPPHVSCSYTLERFVHSCRPSGLFGLC